MTVNFWIDTFSSRVNCSRTKATSCNMVNFFVSIHFFRRFNDRMKSTVCSLNDINIKKNKAYENNDHLKVKQYFHSMRSHSFLSLVKKRSCSKVLINKKLTIYRNFFLKNHPCCRQTSSSIGSGTTSFYSLACLLKARFICSLFS